MMTSMSVLIERQLEKTACVLLSRSQGIMNIKIAIEHDSSQIPVVGKMVCHLCECIGLGDHPGVNKTEVAVVELLNNIVHYSEAGGARGLIEIHCKYTDADFVVTVSERGNVLATEVVNEYTNDAVCMPSINTGTADLPESGWGIQIIKSACDEISYTRSGGRNIFKMIFDLSSATV